MRRASRVSLALVCVALFACGGSTEPAPSDGGSGGTGAAGSGGSGGTGGEGGGGGTGGSGGDPVVCGDDACAASETCAGCPEDCAPEGFGDACSAGKGQCVRAGSMICGEGGALVCDAVAGEPADEICNGEDDDCDGTPDDGIAPAACDTGLEGVCGAGELRCRKGEEACVQAIQPRAEACNNALDDDCGGGRNNGCPAPQRQLLLEPWIGEATGSALEDPAGHARHPVLSWTSSGPTYRYEIELDDSCPVDGWAACALPSPEVTGPAPGTRFTPAAPLPVSVVAPVGARYVARLIECTGNTCQLSAARYFDVGRQRTDFDGDGRADLLVGAPGEGRAYLFLGSATGFSQLPSATLDDGEGPGFGSAVAPAGDVNADGYADALVGADRGDGVAGSAYLLLGGPGGLSWDRKQEIPLPAHAERFGAAVAGAGDVDADGRADVVVGAPGSLAAGRVYLFRGGKDGVDPDPYQTMVDPEDDPDTDFGALVSGAGDLDPASGRSDVIVAAPSSTSNTGKIYVWYGDRLDQGGRFVMPPPNQIKVRYNRVGVAAAVKRVSGGPGARVLLGAPTSTSGTMVGALVILSAEGGGTASTLGAGGFRDDASGCGAGVASGDLDGDGQDDTAMSCTGGQGLLAWQLGDDPMGAAAGDGGAVTGTGSGFGRTLATLGDVDADGRDDVAVARPDADGSGQVVIFRGTDQGLAGDRTWTVDSPSGAAGAMFGAAIAGGR